MIFTEYLYECEDVTAPGYSNFPDDDSKFSKIRYDYGGIVKPVSCPKVVRSRFGPERNSKDAVQTNLITFERVLL